MCTNRNVLIKSAAAAEYQQLSSIPWPVKNMTTQLLSTYQITIKDSLKDILDGLGHNRLSVATAVTEFGSVILSIIVLLLLSIFLFFIRCPCPRFFIKIAGYRRLIKKPSVIIGFSFYALVFTDFSAISLRNLMIMFIFIKKIGL